MKREKSIVSAVGGTRRSRETEKTESPTEYEQFMSSFHASKSTPHFMNTRCLDNHSHSSAESEAVLEPKREFQTYVEVFSQLFPRPAAHRKHGPSTKPKLNALVRKRAL